MPLFMHCRDAGERFAAILEAHGDRGGAPGVLHCFTGSGEELAQCLALDLHIGITGVVLGRGGRVGTASKQAAPHAAAVPAAGTPLVDTFPHTHAACRPATGWVCDDRPERGGAELAALLPTIPPGRLMIETDAPYLVPRTIKPSKARPGRNEPALLPYVLAQVRGGPPLPVQAGGATKAWQPPMRVGGAY